MIATGGTMALAEGIIDDAHVLFHSPFPSTYLACYFAVSVAISIRIRFSCTLCIGRKFYSVFVCFLYL